MYLKKRKRTNKLISLLTTCAMIAAATEPAAAAVSVHLDNAAVLSESYEAVPDNTLVRMDFEPVSQPAMTASEPASGPSIDVTLPDSQPDTGEINADQLPDHSSAAEKAGELSYAEVYNKMNALREKYPEGMVWTNFEPYGSRGTLGSGYTWKGGKILGNVSSGVGCAAFAFILSDAAFGDLKAEVIYDVSFDKVKAGDILRINGNSHSVVVLQKTALGVIVAEGNYNKSVHWGRALSKAEVESADFIVTRYPKNYNPEGGDIVDSVFQEGSVDNNLKWTLTEGGILTISGSGAMKNFSANDRPEWDAFQDRMNTVVIENGVTGIGDYAFYHPSGSDESRIISVSIPKTVSTIGNSAFYNCQSLLSATIPEGVKTIGDMAFQSCTKLEHIDFPSSVTSVGNGAFTGCTAVTSVRFAPGTETVHIGDNLFTYCKNLTNVILPEKADRISSGMFAQCEGISTLYLPEDIVIETGVGSSPFMGCFIKEINYAGSQQKWQQIGGATAIIYMGANKPDVKYNIKFPNPFEPEANDPGDNMGGHVHSWSSAEWNHDANYHWHECMLQGCNVTANNEKDSYAQHSYGSWVVDVSATSNQSGSKHRDCTVCSYRQTSSIPATGSSSSGGSWGWGSSGGSWSAGNTGSGTGSSDKPEISDSSEESTNTDSADNNSDGNTTDSSSGDTNGSGNPDEVGNSDDSGSNLKQTRTKFKKQLKIGLKQQIKAQLKIKLKKQLKAEIKAQSKTKLKKQLKTQLKPQVKAKLKKQLKKQFGKPLGKEFADLFNEQFNAQFNKVYNEQFLVQYKQLLSKQKKIK